MSGPFYFCWVDETETVFGAEHIREDEQVLSFDLTHDEGDFPQLDVTVINPHVGLLAPGRELWAWFAIDTTWQPPDVLQYESDESELPSDVSDPTSEGEVTPLFFGRLVGVPENLTDEQVRLSFIARPIDFAEQKTTVAAAMKVAPYWDGIWFAPENRDDPDNVLEFRPALWHIDRVTHVVTASDVINGEDGNIDVDEDTAFYDSVQVSYTQTPVRRVEVTAGVGWSQVATGFVDLSSLLAFGAPTTIKTLTGDGLIANWPKPGASFGGGWTVYDGSAERVDSVGGAIWKFDYVVTVGFGPNFGRTPEMVGVVMPPEFVSSVSLGTQFPAKSLYIPIQRIRPTLVVQYDADRKRSETLAFAIEADTQAILTDPGDEEILRIDLNSAEISNDVDGSLPLDDLRRNSYFPTTRGTETIEALISMARAKLLARARAVEVEFEAPFTFGVAANLSCRKNARLNDPRLPGGEAAGKIVSYHLGVDGETGASVCDIRIGCTIGNGGTVTEDAGTPTYVEEGYVEVGYQRYDGMFIMPIAGQIAYESIEGLTPANDDGTNFIAGLNPGAVVIDITKTGTVEEQRAALGLDSRDPNEAFERINTVQTSFRVELKPLNTGPYDNEFTFNTSLLKVPKTIDLEAAS